MYDFREIDREQWEKCVLQMYPEANFLHSWQWGDVHDSLGQKVYRMGIFSDQKLVGVFLGIVEDARRGRYLEVPGGPLIDWGDSKLAQFVVDEVKKIAAIEKCVFVRIRPQLELSQQALEDFGKLGFKRANMHLHAEHTTIIDLTKAPDQLLKDMRKQTRYEIKKADQIGVKVESIALASAVEDFYDLQQHTAKRQKFIPPSKKFLTAQAKAFGPKQALLYKAKKNGDLLAMALILLYGQEADYFQGASSLGGRNLPGAYAIQWQAMLDAKTTGHSRYNLFGISPNNNPRHRYAGVTTFKKGFGGLIVDYVPAHDLVLNKTKYAKNWAIEVLRKRIRRV